MEWCGGDAAVWRGMSPVVFREGGREGARQRRRGREQGKEKSKERVLFSPDQKK